MVFSLQSPANPIQFHFVGEKSAKFDHQMESTVLLTFHRVNEDILGRIGPIYHTRDISPDFVDSAVGSAAIIGVGVVVGNH